MKIMAVDYGDSKTGIAICDRTETLASPVGVVEEKSMAKVAEKIVYTSREFEVGMIIIGLPVNMDGTEGKRAAKSRKLGSILETIIDLPIEYWDERNTTKSANLLMTEAGTFGKKRQETEDAVAAAILLDSYLLYRSNKAKQDAH